ncbi:MAG: hypothetical protein QNK37_14690 [Acidobacteriota bacterium]|nr:hypothetical protein [Acidobacteriota bacterium]
MDVRVKFRFNSNTGRVEAFDIIDEGSGLPAAEHNREHDRIAALLGNLIERDPRILELTGDHSAPPQPDVEPEEEDRAENRERDEGRRSAS